MSDHLSQEDIEQLRSMHCELTNKMRPALEKHGWAFFQKIERFMDNKAGLRGRKPVDDEDRWLSFLNWCIDAYVKPTYFHHDISPSSSDSSPSHSEQEEYEAGLEWV